mgnify:CR=1 FL=1
MPPLPWLTAIRARLEAATPGPWAMNMKEGVVLVNPVGKETELHDSLVWATCLADGDFIAHAPTDLATALRLVEAAATFITAYQQHHQPGTTGGTMPTYRVMQDAFATWQRAVEEVELPR